VLLLALWLAVAVFAFRKQMDRERALFGVGLFAFAAVAAAMITAGRLAVDVPTASRYTTLTLFGLVGTWRCALAVQPRLARQALATIVAGLVALGAVTAVPLELEVASTESQKRRELRASLVDWRNRSDEQLKALYPDASEVRQRALMLERLRISVFRQR
jgi:hypothetical protein